MSLSPQTSEVLANPLRWPLSDVLDAVTAMGAEMMIVKPEFNGIPLCGLVLLTASPRLSLILEAIDALDDDHYPRISRINSVLRRLEELEAKEEGCSPIPEP